MIIGRRRHAILCAAALVLGTTGFLPAAAQKTTSAPSHPTRFSEVDLVSDIPGRATITDPKLVNPWGLAMGPGLWVSDNGTDTATVYGGGGTAGPIVKESIEVAVPSAPTGQVSNPGPGFTVTGPGGSGPARFIFATESGTIAGWNSTADPAHAVVAATVPHANFKGLTLVDGRLLAADFFHRRIVVFSQNFQRIPGLFRDPFLPADYAPFNVAAIGGTVFVAYAKTAPGSSDEVTGPGDGFVSQFNASGRFIRRFASRGPLNAPWAITVAPRSFGSFAGALLVGNFGDGRINAYNPRTGRYLGPLRRANGTPMAIEGLWGLEPGTAANGGQDALWFAAGIGEEAHGLLGLIVPAPPPR
ncbi:TIGR03118 family protein [Streptosporangium sp. NPDC087985]|uniref:TIGR03118 family protein n=1 Tax=Streptosporangium sp. NPDC087985 TaxID=3366196 RepID=UPI00381B454E